MSRRQFVIGALAFALATAGATAPRSRRLRGLIIEVSDTIVKVRAADGKVVNFRLGRKVGMPITHMKEHMREEVPVTVLYREDGNELVATRITD